MRPRTLFAAITISFVAGVVIGRCSSEQHANESASTVASHEVRLDEIRAEVVEVIDGDTLLVRLGTKETPTDKVRLLGIDTPERGQPSYRESTEHLRSLIGDRTVTLIADRTHEFRRDRYGRILALVRIDSEQINTAMVRAGWSAFSDKDGDHPWRSQMIAAEEEARAKKRGIWGVR